MQYAILTYDLTAVREYRELDENNLPVIKEINGQPMARPVVWDADPPYDDTTQRLIEGEPIIEPTQVRRRRITSLLTQEERDALADQLAHDALFATMKTYYQVFKDGNANNSQVQQAIAWLIKQEAKQRLEDV